LHEHICWLVEHVHGGQNDCNLVMDHGLGTDAMDALRFGWDTLNFAHGGVSSQAKECVGMSPLQLDANFLLLPS